MFGLSKRSRKYQIQIIARSFLQEVLHLLTPNMHLVPFVDRIAIIFVQSVPILFVVGIVFNINIRLRKYQSLWNHVLKMESVLVSLGHHGRQFYVWQESKGNFSRYFFTRSFTRCGLKIQIFVISFLGYPKNGEKQVGSNFGGGFSSFSSRFQPI
jgi:hypothetical protein